LDLFDVLSISRYENSYTKLTGSILEMNPDIACSFYQRAFGEQPVGKAVRTLTQVSVQHQDDRGRDIPDLVVSFSEETGGQPTDIWLIEAKIGATEGANQTARYSGPRVKEGILESLRAPGANPRWRQSFLTLDGTSPRSPAEFSALAFDKLAAVLPAHPSMKPFMIPAYDCMRDRLLHYYFAKGEQPVDELPFGDYLGQNQGLVSTADLFHWHTTRVLAGMGFETTLAIAQGRGSANPLVTAYRPHWKTKVCDLSDRAALCQSYWVHLELQLMGQDPFRIELVLHYETSPYVAGLSGYVNNDELVRRYLDLRQKFAGRLREQSESSAVLWRFTNPIQDPRSRNQNQIGSYATVFDAEGTVGDFSTWLRGGANALEAHIESVGAEMLWPADRC
jgi:hypothetical protein